MQYTFNWNDKLVLMGGIRADHSSEYGFFVTPRAHIKYNPNDIINYRFSVGKGYRTNHVLAENNFLLASGRKVVIDKHLKQEEARNYGTSVATYIPLFGHTLNINAEYYYTRFQNQLVVDLDSDPTKILEVVEIGKQLLITRGSLTTFSIANDIAKYFAIIPAMFMMAVPELGVLNIMHFATPYSAILSALIFNAIIIPCLIPLAMKGEKYRPMSSGKMLLRNMMIFGVGGVITPFVGIKLIDLIIHPLLALLGL